MAIYPPGVQLAQLSIGPVTDMFGDSATLTVSVTPVFTNGVTHITHTASGHSVAATTKQFLSDETSGIVAITVPVTDQAGWQDPTGKAIDVSVKPGWKYVLKVNATIGRQTAGSWTKEIQPLASQTGEIDVDLVGGENILEGVLAPSAIVLSVAGLTGHVTKAQLENLGLGGGTGGSYNLAIGTVVEGSVAAASITTDPNTGENFLNLTLVKGDKGEPGTNGRGVSSITDTDANGTATITYSDGTTQSLTLPRGLPGTNGQGVPVGGATGEILAKNSTANYDTKWIPAPTGGGTGGVTDHGALTGLGDDDHTQYALADGTRGSFPASAITSGTFAPARLPAASATDQGALSAADKTKLDNATSAIYANRLLSRDAFGRAKVADPAADDDISTRGWTNTQLATKAASTHSHAYSSLTDIPAEFTPAAHSHAAATATAAGFMSAADKTKLDGAPTASHTHDDRYYTETEVDTKLGTKEPTSWTGTQAQYNALATKSATTTYYITG